MQMDYDVIVIGGGINGCGIANDAAGRGLNVLLCEKNDLASGTSSNSTKLIHGGLRYLEHYEFRLVKDALAEREVLLKNAPHIIWPLRFILPHRPHLRPRWMIKAGLFLYDHLSKRTTLKGSCGVSFDSLSPLNEKMTNGFEYSDAWVDDARLVVLNALSAKAKGATIKTQCACLRAERNKEGWLVTLQDNILQTTSAVSCKVLINAGGPWAGKLFDNIIEAKAPQNVRLVKGSHIVVPKIHSGNEAYILQNEDQRIVFIIPYEEQFSLIGTTDVEVNQDPAEIDISDDEVEYLINVTNKHFKRSISRNDIVHTFSGVRPLLDDESSSAQAITRDYTLELDANNINAPLLSVFGGKITTYRKLAEAAINKMYRFFPSMGESWTKNSPLPGGDFNTSSDLKNDLQKKYAWLDVKIIERYVRSYGTISYKILESCKNMGDMGYDFGEGLYFKELEYLVREEWVLSVEDLLWRRTKLGLLITDKQEAAIDVAIQNISQHDLVLEKELA